MKVLVYPVDAEPLAFEKIDDMEYLGGGHVTNFISHEPGDDPRRLLRINEGKVVAIMLLSDERDEGTK